MSSGCKRSSIMGTCSPHFGIWQLRMRSPRQDVVLQQEIEKSRIGLLGLLLAITALKLGVWLEYWKKLKWESREKEERYTCSRLILLYKGPKGAASIPTDYLITPCPPQHTPPPTPPPIRCSRNHHSLTFQTPLKELTVSSFSGVWKVVWHLQELILLTNNQRLECPSRFDYYLCWRGADDGVARFTSLVRAWD